MAKHYGSYPIRTTSRSVTRKRARRLSWFVIGTTFGIGCASALMPILPSGSGNAPVVMAAAPTQAAGASSAIIAAAESAAPIIAAPAETPSEIIDTPAKEVVLATAPQTESKQQYPVTLDLKVASGDTLASLITDAGASQAEAHNVLEATKKHFDPRKLTAGQNISIVLGKPDEGSEIPTVKSVKIPLSLTASLEVKRSKDNGFAAKKLDVPLERTLARAGGKINSSLYETASGIGLPSSMVGEIINAYSYDVDFQRDIQQGDSIDVLYESLRTPEGRAAGTGNLIFAELNLGSEVLKIYRYVDKSGNADFYNSAGESVRKALLRTPINGARITSGYGMRNHPIMGYNKMHRGVDFGAPTGTPIYAAGDATVEFVGRKGGYGNFLKLKHSNQYASAYAHLSRFASGIMPGKKVKQGQIVAYVGSTGNSTGPHLHYEILVNGNQVNPSGVKFKTGTVLKGKELAAFRQTMEKIEAKLDGIKNGSNDIAMADFERDVYN